MIRFGVCVGLTHCVDRPREPSADSPRSAAQCPVVAGRGLRRCRLHLRHSFEYDKARLSVLPMQVVAEAQSDKFDFLSVSLGFLMLAHGWPTGFPALIFDRPGVIARCTTHQRD